MGKLSLLQEKTKKEKNDLMEKALENEKKEQALNKYQQIIRNIINANILAKARIQRRDKIIKTKKQEIKQKDQTIREKEQTIAQIPLLRIGTPSDVANVAVFLASKEANYITGAVLPVDGGLRM